MPCARIMRFEELINHPQVTQNHYIEPAETEHWGKVYATGLPWTFSRTPASVLPTADGRRAHGRDPRRARRHRAAATGNGAMSTGPLDGYRVVELGQGIPAAVAGMHLGDGGADVIKVEHRGGDVARDDAALLRRRRQRRLRRRQPQQAQRRARPHVRRPDSDVLRALIAPPTC